MPVVLLVVLDQQEPLARTDSTELLVPKVPLVSLVRTELLELLVSTEPQEFLAEPLDPLEPPELAV